MSSNEPKSEVFFFFSSPLSLHHGKSSSTGNLLENDGSLPTPDYGLTARLLAQSLAQTRPRPYSMAGFGTQVQLNMCSIHEQRAKHLLLLLS